MTVADLVSRTLWLDIGKELRGGAFKWWNKHESSLTALTKQELFDLANHLRAGDRRGAKDMLVKHLVSLGPTSPVWIAFRNGTTDNLHDLAARRAAAIEAVTELGWFAARAVGKAIKAAALA